MVATNRNVKVFSEGISKAKKMIDDKIVEALIRAAKELILDAEFEKEYNNLTGNTLTSYAVGIYSKWSLRAIISIYDVDSGIDRPTRTKLSNKKGYQKVIHYDTGDEIYVKTDSFEKTSAEYGHDTSEEFLRGYIPDNGGYVIVMCTGTEYSGILEYGGLNVLTETFIKSPRIFFSNLKRIKR